MGHNVIGFDPTLYHSKIQTKKVQFHIVSVICLNMSIRSILYLCILCFILYLSFVFLDYLPCSWIVFGFNNLCSIKLNQLRFM